MNIIHVASVPLDELQDPYPDIKRIVANILGIEPNIIMDKEDYRRLREFLHEDIVPEDMSLELRHQVDDLIMPGKDRDLFSDFVACSSTSATFPAQNLIDRYAFGRKIVNEGFRLELLETAQKCYMTRFVRSRHTNEFLDDLYGYEIPLGQSPAVKSDSLLRLLETSKNFCVAPLALGGAQAVNELTKGDFVSALLTTGTGGAMSLLLIGTVSVGALLVQRVAQTRANSRTPPPPPPRRGRPLLRRKR